MKLPARKQNHQSAAKKILQWARKKHRRAAAKKKKWVNNPTTPNVTAAANEKELWWQSLTWEERSKEQARIAAGIKHYRLYEPIDTNDAITIYIDPQELELDSIDTDCLGVFLNHCYNRYVLEVYDHPGDSRCGGFYHKEGESCNQGVSKMVADFAYDWYRDNIPEGSRMMFKEVTKMSCSPDCNAFYFTTFTVVNQDTGEDKTLQAQVMELNLFDWQLGMLRDVSCDRVLAIMKLNQVPTGETAEALSNVLEEDIWEKVLPKNIETCLSVST